MTLRKRSITGLVLLAVFLCGCMSEEQPQATRSTAMPLHELAGKYKFTPICNNSWNTDEEVKACDLSHMTINDKGVGGGVVYYPTSKAILPHESPWDYYISTEYTIILRPIGTTANRFDVTTLSVAYTPDGEEISRVRKSGGAAIYDRKLHAIKLDVSGFPTRLYRSAGSGETYAERSIAALGAEIEIEEGRIRRADQIVKNVNTFLGTVSDVQSSARTNSRSSSSAPSQGTNSVIPQYGIDENTVEQGKNADANKTDDEQIESIEETKRCVEQQERKEEIDDFIDSVQLKAGTC